MTWMVKRCKLGHMHKIWTQERDNACGPSCMMMAYERVMGSAPADEKLFYQAYNLYGSDNEAVARGRVPARTTSGFEYTYANTLADAMSKFIGKATARNVGRGNVAESVFAAMMGHQKPKPVIGLVNWSGGGGHFVLIDKITMQEKFLQMCVCDPWDGDVHVIGAPLGGAMPYRTTHGPSQHTTLQPGRGVGPAAVPTAFASPGGRAVGAFNGWLITFL